ncbi:hypothetical protein EC968_000797 [Mortierella alpina]|nr:hypothetical protein EC968_000797 [Mortierella alpina]
MHQYCAVHVQASTLKAFVRSLHSEEDLELEMPFIYTQFGVVLMVDIVGFSQMTSLASKLGHVGAERLSSQIGEYFNLAIRIIENNGGDVVKFLGDALLVVFQADPVSEHFFDDTTSTNAAPLDSPNSDDPTAASRRNKVLVRKAIQCGLELLSRLSSYRINLSEEEYSQQQPSPILDDARAGGGGAGHNDEGNGTSFYSLNNHSGSGNHWNGTVSSATGSISSNSHLLVPITRINSYGNNGNGGNQVNNLDLIGAGGSVGSRKWDDPAPLYSRPGSTTSRQNRAGAFFANAKNLFTPSGTKSDRQGMAAEDISEDSHELQLHLALSAGPISNIIIGDIGRENGLDNLLEQTTGRLEYAVCGEQMADIDDALNMARAGELTITPSAWKFVNPDAYPWFEPRRHCFILKDNKSVHYDDKLLSRVRNDKLLNKSVESNPHYYKYINKSAIHRLILYPDNKYPAQFRNVTILFVSLGDIKAWTPEGLDICQRAIYQIHRTTSEYEGFIQQFAVDDKGATILCAFGLPYPRSHEREAVFAAKSAWVIRRRLLSQQIFGFKISLATGVIFTSMIGNEYRQDPAIVGDTIVVAVRILKFDYATESVVCDDATKEACTSDHDGLCEFELMGDEFVKGKIQPLRIWRLVHFGAKKQIRRPDDIMVDETIGYEPEREKVSELIKSWEREPDRNTIMVSGPRGSGKSMFYQQICHIADKNGYQICSAASAEVEKNTEYYVCKFLLLGLFAIMRKKEIPYSSRAAPQDLENINATGTVSKDGVECQEHIPQRTRRRQSTSTSLERSATGSTSTTDSTTASAITSAEDFAGSTMGTPSADDFYSPLNSKFGPSVRSSVISNSLWDPPSSPIVGQHGESSKRSSTYISKLKALINVALQKMGEGDDMMHMLHDIIAALSSDNSAPIMNDQDDDMLADFIVRMLNYASYFVKIIVMFEDVQWTDKKSLSIIHVIHERCPRVLVVVFSRPQRDYGASIFHHITKHNRHLVISLEGLKRREIELALLKTFEDKGVVKISPEVIELVQEKTKGNPKFVKNMASMLKDFSHVNIVEGELLTTGGQDSKQSPSFKNMEEMLVKQDKKMMILMQYDRISVRFQEFLKIASCLGEQFSLAEVNACWRTSTRFPEFLKIAGYQSDQATVEEINKPWPLEYNGCWTLEVMLGAQEKGKSFPNLISDEDVYKFLAIATDQLTNVQFSENVVMNTIYRFSSESTAKVIYESIPYKERVGYHYSMGKFYEHFLASAQQSDLLPQITRHFLKTDLVKEKIHYLTKLAAFDLKSNMLMDATKSLTELINILDTARGASNAVTQEELAHIYGMKGESLSKRMRIEEAEPALLDSLARYGIHWPKTSQQWRMALFMERTKFMFHFPGVSTPGPHQSDNAKPPKARVDAKTQITLERIIRVLGCLQNVYFWRTEPDAAMLSCLYTLNFSRRLGLPSSEQTVSLGRYGLLYYFKGDKKTCMDYLEKAIQADKAGHGTDGMLPSMRAYVEYCEGHPEKAHKQLANAINESKSFGVVSHLATYYRAVTMKCAYRMWEGSFNVHPEDSALLRAMSAVAIQNGDSEGETLFAIPTLANLLLQDRLRDAESWVVLIERFIMPKARLMNALVIHGMLAYYYAKMGSFAKTRIYVELLAERLSEQGIAAHPFPLMSCAFAVMALYEMLDNSISMTGIASEYLCSHRTEVILRPIIHSLTQDPFQAVSQCFVILAEALRCFIVQGQSRDGFLKLQRGWDRVKERLEGINFVKAYFLARLGRHADQAWEKDDYYTRAYVIFCSMAMDSSGYITDPTPGWQPPHIEGSEATCAIGAIPTPR